MTISESIIAAAHGYILDEPIGNAHAAIIRNNLGTSASWVTGNTTRRELDQWSKNLIDGQADTPIDWYNVLSAYMQHVKRCTGGGDLVLSGMHIEGLSPKEASALSSLSKSLKA